MGAVYIDELTKRVKCGIISGALSGILIGISEAFVILWTTATKYEYSVLLYAAILYSIIGLLTGLILSIAGFIMALPFISLWDGLLSKVYFRAKEIWKEMPEGIGKASYKAFYTLYYQIFNRYIREKRAFAAYFSIILFIFATVITRYIVKKDIFYEQRIPLQVSILIEIIILIFSIFFYLFLKGLVSRGIFQKVLTWKGFTITYLFILLICLVLSLAPLLIGREGVNIYKPITQKLATAPNIILIGADALRFDYISPYNEEVKYTPAIQRLSSDSILFKNAFAHASWTKASFNTIMTGLYPSSHQGYRKADILPEEVETLAEILSKEGYLTGAITNNSHLTKLFNFDQGFDDFIFMEPDFFFYANETSSHLSFYNVLRLLRERFLYDKKYVDNYYKDASTILEKAKSWIDEKRTSRFFLFIHLMEPHDPYFRHPYNGEAVARVDTPFPDPEKVEYLKELYRGEVEYMDRNLGDFFDSLKKMGIYKDLVIFFTSDHGEEFYEHKGWWHGTTLYEEQIRIPLMIKLRGNRDGGKVIEEFARHIDIVPTILHLAGIEPSPGLPGRNLLKDEIKDEDRYIFAEEDFEGNILHASRTDEWKYIRANKGNPRGLPEKELFDLKHDRGETKNLVDIEKDAIPYMESLIHDTLKVALGKAVKREEVEIDRTTKERLKALGYVE